MTRTLPRMLCLGLALAAAGGCAGRAALPRPTTPFTPTPDAEFRTRAPEPWPAPPPARASRFWVKRAVSRIRQH